MYVKNSPIPFPKSNSEEMKEKEKNNNLLSEKIYLFPPQLRREVLTASPCLPTIS